MKAIVQRVLSASVTVDSQLVSSISKGLLVFAAVGPDDDESDAANLAGKVLKMKFWDDEEGGKEDNPIGFDNKHVPTDAALIVSQFTLLANTKKGSKPDFHGAMAPDRAKALYETFFRKVQQGYQPERVKDGVFQAMMQVALVNDGPVTLELNTPDKKAQLRPQKMDKLAKLKGTETPGSTSDAA